MRQPRNHAEVAHQWASREVESGSNGNMSFSNNTIYSYGWWPMAKFYKTRLGNDFVVMRSWTYSSSTGKHMSHVHNAIPKNIPIWYADEISLLSVLDKLLSRLKENYDSFFVLKNHAKTSTEDHIAQNQGIYSKAEEFCEMTGSKMSQDFDKYLLSESEINSIERMLVPYLKEMEIKRAKADRMKEIIEAAKERVFAKFADDPIEMAKLWIQHGGEPARRSWWGEKINLPQDDPDVKASKLKFITRSMETAMRIVDDEVVTNHSARVPVDSAKRLWNLMKRKEQIIGEKVGLYTVVKNNGELVIGCHHIKREIVDYFVEYYNW